MSILNSIKKALGFTGTGTPLLSENELANRVATLSSELQAGADPMSKMDDTNAVMHLTFRKVAVDLAEWASSTHSKIHAGDSRLEERDVLKQMLDSRITFPGGEKSRDIILDRFESIHGVCYFLALSPDDFKGMMAFRCIQLIEYVDIALQEKGVKSISDETKRKYFKTLGLPEEEVGKSHL